MRQKAKHKNSVKTTNLKIKRPDRWDQPYGKVLSSEELFTVIKHEPFSLINPEHFPNNRSYEMILKNDGRMRKFKASEVITLQGDASNSCYLLLQGKVRIILLDKSKNKLSKKFNPKNKLWTSIKQLWQNHKTKEYRNPHLYSSALKQENASGMNVRTIENPTKIIQNSKTAIIKPGSFFGEVAALSRSTRSATLFADSEVLVYELRWQGLRDLRLWDKKFKDWVEDLFHQRDFLPLFTKNPLLATLADLGLEQVAKSSRFQAYGDQGWYKTLGKLRQIEQKQNNLGKTLIVGEGQHLDGLLLIRGGFVQVTQSYGHNEKTAGYLVSNELYGLTSIMEHSSKNTTLQSRFNLYALGYVDLLVIPTETVIQYLLPHWQRLKVFDDELFVKKAAPMYVSDRVKSPLPQSLLETLFEQRIINGSATMVIDNNACIGCDDCVRACASAHDNNPRFIRHGTKHAQFTFANACMHCIDPVCLSDCPTGAIHRPTEHSIVQINDNACIGCSNCANSCPYDNIRMVTINDEKENPILDELSKKPITKATKCDLCTDQITGPACENACSYGALKRINFSDRNEVSAWFSERY